MEVADFTFSLLDAMTKLQAAWHAGTPGTISNCFKKAAMFSPDGDVQNDSPMDIIEDALVERLRDNNIITNEFSVEHFVGVDEDLAVFPPDSEPVSSAAEPDHQLSDEDDNCGAPLEVVTSTAAMMAPRTVGMFLCNRRKIWALLLSLPSSRAK